MILKERHIVLKRSKIVPNSVVAYFATTASDENDVRKNVYSQKYGFSKSQLNAISRGFGISYLHIPKVTLQYGKGWSEKHLRHCLYTVETFPDTDIVYILCRQLRLTKQKLSSLRNVFLSYRKERKGFSQRTLLSEKKLFNFALFALSLRTLR